MPVRGRVVTRIRLRVANTRHQQDRYSKFLDPKHLSRLLLLVPDQLERETGPTNTGQLSRGVARETRVTEVLEIKEAVGLNRMQLNVVGEEIAVFNVERRLCSVGAFVATREFVEVLVRIRNQLRHCQRLRGWFFALKDLGDALLNEIKRAASHVRQDHQAVRLIIFDLEISAMAVGAAASADEAVPHP